MTRSWPVACEQISSVPFPGWALRRTAVTAALGVSLLEGAATSSLQKRNRSPMRLSDLPEVTQFVTVLGFLCKWSCTSAGTFNHGTLYFAS